MKKTTKQKALEDALELLSAASGGRAEITLKELAKPPQAGWGDISFACFALAKSFKKKPEEVAADLAELINEQLGAIKKKTLIQKAACQGAYVNFFINSERFTGLLFKRLADTGEKFGQSDLHENERVVVEYASPNTNKPLTLGHVRNIALGWSVAELLKTQGWKVFKAEIRNDRGAAICKAMLGWEKWGQGQTPKQAKKKGDHFMGEYYVKFNQELAKNEGLKDEIQDCLKKWEEEDHATRKVWKKTQKWVLAGIEETYKTLGADFDKAFYESQIYKQGAEVARKALEEGNLDKDEKGNVIASLDGYGLPSTVLLRADGTSVYMTQDLQLAQEKYKAFKFDKSIHIIGSEQDLQMKQLFAVFEVLGMPWAKRSEHLSYGMVNLPTGKMKSREGVIVDADNLITKVQDLAKEEIRKRDEKVAAKDLERRSRQLALGAIKYYILQVDPKTLMTFDPAKSIALQGRTGPYLQYTAVRMRSILAKAKRYAKGPVDHALLSSPEEHALAVALADFPEVIARAAGHYDPSILAKHLYDLAKSFSVFYEKNKVIDEKSPDLSRARVRLTQHSQLVLEKGLSLLGIQVPDKM